MVDWMRAKGEPGNWIRNPVTPPARKSPMRIRIAVRATSERFMGSLSEHYDILSPRVPS